MDKNPHVLPTDGALGVFTGIAPDVGFAAMGPVFAYMHDYGLGVGETLNMLPTIKYYIANHEPCTTENWREWYTAALAELGETVEVGSERTALR